MRPSAFLKKANAQEPKQANICFNLGRCYFNIGKLTKAIKFYAEAIKIAPSFAEAHHNLGHALLAKEGLKRVGGSMIGGGYLQTTSILEHLCGARLGQGADKKQTSSNTK